MGFAEVNIVAVAAVTYYDALLRLAACQIWIRSGGAKNGTWYGAALLRRLEGFDTTLKNPSRKVALRLANMHVCYSCGIHTAPTGDGDHLIPKSKGGPHDLSNYAPMCSRCNSKKGSRDLMEWWAGEGRPLAELHVDVVVAFARVSFNLLSGSGLMDSLAPGCLVDLLNEFAESLPSSQHTKAFRGIRAEGLFQLALPI